MRFKTLLILLFLFNGNLLATIMSFLKNAPISEYSSEELDIMEKNIYKALDTLADGETREWQSSNPKNNGKVTIIKTLKNTEKNCRQAEIINKTTVQKGTINFIFCKNKNDQWKISN